MPTLTRRSAPALVLGYPLRVGLAVAAALAQIGGGYDLTRNSIDGGGATFSRGGAYQLGGTVGQPARQ